MRPLTVLLAAPRGFCAGVRRAVQAVEDARAATDRPIYVRHQIIHNRRVTDRLETAGVRFVDELEQIPPDAVAVLSAHGGGREVAEQAARRAAPVLDATCPLVRRVHLEAARSAQAGRKIVVIGHEGHPEVTGILGHINGEASVAASPAEVEALGFAPEDPVAYVVQTTLSVDDARAVIAALHARYADVAGPDVRTICYATQNRQTALRRIAGRADRLVVCGARNSSNANRLREVGEAEGRPTLLIEEAGELPRAFVEEAEVLGVTAAASTPEELVQELLDRLASWRAISVSEVGDPEENVRFAPVDLGALA